MGFLSIGKKIYEGLKKAQRLGEKVKNFFGSRKIGNKTTEAQEKFDDSVKAISYKDLTGEIKAPQAVKRVVSIKPQQLVPAKGVSKVKNLLKVAKEIQRVVGDKPQSLMKIKEDIKEVKNIATLPSKKQIRDVSREQAEIQKSLNIGRMNKEEFKKYQKKQEKMAKKKARKRR